MLSGNNARFSLPYCILALTLDALEAWVTQETQYAITTPILCCFTLSKDSFWVTLNTKCLSNLLFFFKRTVALSYETYFSTKFQPSIHARLINGSMVFSIIEKKVVIKRKSKFTLQNNNVKV